MWAMSQTEIYKETKRENERTIKSVKASPVRVHDSKVAVGGVNRGQYSCSELDSRYSGSMVSVSACTCSVDLCQLRASLQPRAQITSLISEGSCEWSEYQYEYECEWGWRMAESCKILELC